MKKILFKSNVLAILSVGLLVAVFAAIGMSFTPLEEEEIVTGQTGDTTTTRVVRRSHWVDTSCGIQDKDKSDYAEITAVTSGNGSVTIQNTTNVGSLTATQTKTTTSVADNSVAITWNCNNSTEGHTNTFQLTANPDDGYVFDHWEINNTPQGKDNPLNYRMTIPHGDRGDSQNQEYESDNAPYRVSIKAFFVQKREAQITLTATSGGTYTYVAGNLRGTISSTSQETITTDETIVFSAIPQTGYQFFAWNAIDETGAKQVLSFNSDFTTAFSENTVIEAEFIPADQAVFVIKGTVQYYHDLNQACQDALASVYKTVIPVRNGTLYAGEYNVPSGVTLLIPFDEAYTVYTEQNTTTQIEGGVTNKANLFRKLTMATGAHLVVNGALCVGAKQGASTPNAGVVSGKYGQIEMLQGSSIEMQSGSNLYAWGYITGEGEITAHTGAVVCEYFQITDFRGGRASGKFTGSERVFPFNQYYVQNIEVPLKIEYGATEKIYTCVSTSLGLTSTSAGFIGADGTGLFRLKEGAYLTKRYDGVNDRLLFTINGNADLASLSMDVGMNINTKEYALPINSNMSIILESGTMTLQNEVALLPGVEITIKEDAILNIAANGILHVYDQDEWGLYAAASKALAPIGYAPSKQKIRTAADLKDVRIDIQGKLTCAGAVYTTASGADICCTAGEGQFVWETAAKKDATTYQATQSNTDVSFVKIPETPARLHNADDSYTPTASAAAGTVFNYCRELNKWLKGEGDCPFGEKLEIVDWTDQGPVLNMNGYTSPSASAGWTISADGKDYTETNCDEDLTLQLALSQTYAVDAEVLILAKGTDGVVESYRKYKVPHVFNANATLGAVAADNSSVIFVRSGKLTVTGDAAVAAIYVAPGAELCINADVTLATGKLVLRTSPQAAAVLTNNGIVEGQVYYSRIVRNAERLKLFQIALPFDVTLNDIMLSNGKRFDYSKTIGLMEYNAARRAQKGPDNMNWKGINPNEITAMSGSKGYQLLSTLKAYNEYYFPVTLSEQTQVKVETQDANDIKDIYDAGWNFLCSPSAGRVDVSDTDPANQLKIYEYVEAEGDQPAYYKQSPATILQPAMPFFYQTAANGSLVFDTQNSIVSFEPAVATQQAPRRLSAQNVPTQWLQLYYGANENMADQTNIYLHPMRFTTDYQPGYDGVKMSTSGTRPFVWSSLSYGELAFAALPDSVATEMGIALTVFAPSTQAMTFSLSENDWLSRLQSVYLLDREQQTLTDLLQNDYSYDAAAGTTAGRFVVYPIFRAPDMTDGVELPDMTAASFTAYGTNREIWVNGLSVGMALRCYDLMGRLVYDGTADSDMMTIALPAPGIYFVQAMDEVQKVIVK